MILIFLFAGMLHSCISFGQEVVTADSLHLFDSTKMRIESVSVSGNRRTKTFIILREMQFHAGDSLRKDRLPLNFQQARNQVYNTNLFTEVILDSSLTNTGGLAVNVRVKEKWYIYPTPQFQLADRSFNEWIKTYHADLDRVVYGAKFAHYNFSGRRDQLRVYLLNGYARNVTLSYSKPYANKALNRGFSFSAGYTQNREIAYNTTYYNKLLQYNPEGFVRKNVNVGGSLSRRNGFFKTTGFAAGLSFVSLADSVLTKYNPDYYGSSKTSRVFGSLSYNFRYLNTNNNNYPLKGKSYGGGIGKSGIGWKGGVNNLNVSGDYSQYFTHQHNFYSTLQLSAFIRLPFDQPYINRRAMGYGGFYLRGLEDYVIDGVAASIIKYTFSKKVVAFKIPIPFHIKAFPSLPFKIFAKTFADAGYSYIPGKYESRLNNKMLYSGGFGLDILTLYDINIRFEYSFNQLGEKGLFLHGKSGF